MISYAGALSGGERRLLELARALLTDPDVLLVDEPSIGLEPRAIDEVFDLLSQLRQVDGKTIIIAEQNVKKEPGVCRRRLRAGQFSGRVALADEAKALLVNPDIGALFLGVISGLRSGPMPAPPWRISSGYEREGIAQSRQA